MAAKKMNFDIPKEKKEAMIAEIQGYFLKERDEEIGNLSASLMLDFILEKLAPQIYNQGIYDAYKYFTDKTEDLLGLQK